MADPDQEPSLEHSAGLKISTLCEMCEKMAQTYHLGPGAGEGILGGKMERDIDEIRAGAVTDCPLCLVAWRRILKVGEEQSDQPSCGVERLDFAFGDLPGRMEFAFRIHRDYPDGSKTIIFDWLSFCPLRGPALRTAQLAAAYEYSVRTAAKPVARLIESWYRQCMTQHARCSSPVSAHHPPRVLEIQRCSFRLVIPRECSVEGPYATLSHCWGQAPNFLKLTSANIEQLRQWNPTNLLPQTFQDAAQLCHRLHIGYLWIDSLCILQAGEGSAEDWSLHVTEMRTIYSNGVLNIAASRAAASNEGMYSSRDARHIRPAIIQGNNRFGLSNELYLLIRLEFIGPGYSCPPLNERGWVFQERLLSPRVVHFEGEQVFWECTTDALCETYPAGSGHTYNRGSSVAPFELPTKQTCRGASELWQVYTRLVTHYTSCQFTFPDKDKLAAFAGIAQHISREFDDEYFAGMFRSQLPMALLWVHPAAYSKEAATQLREDSGVVQLLSNDRSCFPSWSWIGVENGWDPLKLYDIDLNRLTKHYVTIQDVQVTAVDPKNPFGNLKSAYINLDARLLSWETTHAMPGDLVTFFDSKEEACIRENELFIIPFFAESADGTKYTVFPDLSDRTTHMVYFLIVRKLGTAGEERYRRVGMARLGRGPGFGTELDEPAKELSTIDEIFEADVIWCEYLSVVEPRHIMLV